jgi:hypothetical protein
VRLHYKSRAAAANGKREISQLLIGSAAVFIFRQFAIAAHFKASSQLRHQTGISNALILLLHEERSVHYLWHIDSVIVGFGGFVDCAGGFVDWRGDDWTESSKPTTRQATEPALNPRRNKRLSTAPAGH